MYISCIFTHDTHPFWQYALAAWATNPVGEVENRVLLFPMKGIAGAYFPGDGGMPELPKTSGAPTAAHPAPIAGPSTNPPPVAPAAASNNMPFPPHFIQALQTQMTPEQFATFNSLPPDKKLEIAKGFANRMKQRAQQAQQQQKQQQAQQQAQQQQQLLQQQAAAAAQAQMHAQMGLGPPQPPQAPPSVQLAPGTMNPWAGGGGPNVAAILGQMTNPSGAPAGLMQNAHQQQQQQQGAGGPQQGLPGLTHNIAAMAAMASRAGLPLNMGPMNPMAGVSMNFAGLGGGAQQQQQQKQAGQQAGQGPGMHRRTPSGNIPAGVSYEMLQSFMQRSQEGGGPNGSLGGMA